MSARRREPRTGEAEFRVRPGARHRPAAAPRQFRRRGRDPPSCGPGHVGVAALLAAAAPHERCRYTGRDIVKIAHLVGWYFPDSVGGTEVYVEGLCRRLREAGHEVIIAAPDAGHGPARRYEYDGVPVFRYPIADQPTRDEAYHRVAMAGSAHLFRWLADERPDILHVHSI